jgi:hypothetical protein
MPSFTAMSGGIAMVPTLFFYELGLIALVWLFLMQGISDRTAHPFRPLGAT